MSKLINLLFEPQALLVWSLSHDHGVLTVEGEIDGRPAHVIVPPSELSSLLYSQDQARVALAWEALIVRSKLLNIELRLLDPAGEPHWFHIVGRVWQSAPQAATGPFLGGTARSINLQKQEEQRSLEHQAQLHAVIDQSSIGIYIKDLQGKFLLTNRAIQQFAARRGGALGGMSATKLLKANEHEQIQSIDQQVLNTRKPMVIEQEFTNENETESRSFSVSISPYWQAGQVSGLMGHVQEITERKRQEVALAELNRTLEAKVLERTRDLQLLNEQLWHANLHDPLTQLPNRAQLKTRLQALIDRPNHGGIRAMLFIDLDKFKSVNDNLGHAAGDELLLQVGERLREMQTAHDMVARLGGDEFVMLVEALPSREAALEMAEKVEALFLRPFEVAGRELLMSASLGLTICDDAGGSAEEFLQQADMAMYRAKTRQGGHYELFNPEIRERRQMLVSLQQDIKHALRRGEVFVQYQPVVTLPHELIAGFEALVRWQHPVHGLISPAEFIPVAEDAGVIHDIDLWVLRQACRATRQYVHVGHLYKLSVNLSTKNFLFADLVPKLRHILEEENFPSDSLIIEVTESILVEDFQTVSTMMWELRAMGILIAADDFGTGYSSLSYLHRLPFTSVKLDRSFVSSLEHTPAILRSVLELAGQLGLSVVAEGVETAHQAAALAELNCAFAQGYHFDKPLSEAEMHDRAAQSQRMFLAQNPRP